MKILLYGINFSPELTGVGKYTGEMADWLASHSHDVRVVTAPPYYPEWRVRPGYRKRWYALESSPRMRVRRCPIWVPRHLGGLNRLVHLLSFAVSSFPVMLAQIAWRPDVVWVAEPPLVCAPAAVLVSRLSRARSWLHIQDFELDAAFQLGFFRDGLMRRLAEWTERTLMRRFDRVSTVSERMLELAAAKGVAGERLVLFPNWADVTPADPAVLGPMRAEWGISDAQVVALYSGTMGRKQGLGLLAQAAKALESVAPGLVFVFCGTGPGRPELEASCRGLSNVLFLDLQPLERLGALLAMADIHLLPQSAGVADLVMPSKLTGILASGRPVVATSAPGTELARVVEDCGLVVPPGDAAHLAQAIERLVADTGLRAGLGARARAYAEDHLAPGLVLGRFETQLEELAGRRGSR